jgi:hypothetical protein
LRDIPEELASLLCLEIHELLTINMSHLNNKSSTLEVKSNLRIYESHYGIVRPHCDIPMCGDDTHTCLIYLTEDFVGGVLSIQFETAIVTFMPKIGHAIVYPKHVIHYTDEQLEGEKVILLVDVRIIETNCNGL